MQVAVLLHNIRSAHNVGSIFRTADTAGVKAVYLSGYTPLPHHKFGRIQSAFAKSYGRAQKEIAKTALGAEKTMAWQHISRLNSWLQRMKREGWRVVGVEQDARARDYRTFNLKQKTLFVFGNEVRGLSPAFLAQCDELVEIPMRGIKESLNVSVATGIILFHFLS